MVDRPQMCRSCTALTPGSARNASRTSATSTPLGAASKARLTESFNRLQVPIMMTTTMPRLTRASITAQPVSRMTAPATTTPSDTAASAIMCR
ncbi:hypothetical protein D3C86_2011450 [compost metagenome]